LRFLTDFADLGLLLPLAVCVGVGLAIAGWPRGALAWAVALGATLGLMLALKLAFLGCGSAHALSPSGHTAAGTAFYGGIAALWLRRWLGPWLAALLAGGSVAALIGMTRLALHAHVPIEVVMGALVGISGILLLLRGAGPPPARLRVTWLVPAALVIAFMLHGVELQAEPRLRAFAGWLPASVCSALP
jgi:membrane-associated phospholipid phosphatase